MSFGISILADASPIQFEKLILGDNPGMLWTAIYGVLVVAAVFLPLISVIAMISIWA